MRACGVFSTHDPNRRCTVGFFESIDLGLESEEDVPGFSTPDDDGEDAEPE